MKVKLYFKGRCLGSISDVQGDQPWWIGVFTPFPEANAFKAFFQWIVDEDRNTLAEDPPFDQALWTDENWFIEAEDGKKNNDPLQC